jgi:L-methionine (R)-S-oxide reductase
MPSSGQTTLSVAMTLKCLRELALSSGERRSRAAEAAELIRAARGFHWAGLYDVIPPEIAIVAWTGPTAPAFPRFPIDKGINGAAVAARKHVVVQDVGRDPRYLTTFSATRAEAIFVVASPSTGEIIGTIDVESDRVNSFTPEHEQFLAECAQVLTPLWITDAQPSA